MENPNVSLKHFWECQTIANNDGFRHVTTKAKEKKNGQEKKTERNAKIKFAYNQNVRLDFRHLH